MGQLSESDYKILAGVEELLFGTIPIEMSYANVVKSVTEDLRMVLEIMENLFPKSWTWMKALFDDDMNWVTSPDFTNRDWKRVRYHNHHHALTLFGRILKYLYGGVYEAHRDIINRTSISTRTAANWKLDRELGNTGFSIERRAIKLFAIACLYHDWKHSHGKETDDGNTTRAASLFCLGTGAYHQMFMTAAKVLEGTEDIRIVEDYKNMLTYDIFGRLDNDDAGLIKVMAFVRGLIRESTYPYSQNQLTFAQALFRDADALTMAGDDWFFQIYYGLCQELLQGGANIYSINDFADGQLAFSKGMTLFTKSFHEGENTFREIVQDREKAIYRAYLAKALIVCEDRKIPRDLY